MCSGEGVQVSGMVTAVICSGLERLECLELTLCD